MREHFNIVAMGWCRNLAAKFKEKPKYKCIVGTGIQFCENLMFRIHGCLFQTKLFKTTLQILTLVNALTCSIVVVHGTCNIRFYVTVNQMMRTELLDWITFILHHQQIVKRQL